MIRRALIYCMLPIALTGPLTGSAAADDVVAVDSRGSATGEGKAARQRAVDQAFAKAVEVVLSRMLSPELRQRHAGALRDNVVRRARLYVAQFKVIDERADGATLSLRVSVSVDRDKVRGALAELGVRETPARRRRSGERPRVVVLLKYTAGDHTVTNFGKGGGDGGAAARAIAAELVGQGFETVPTVGIAVPLMGDAEAGVPISDDAAIEIARNVGAGGAFVVGVDAQPEGRIRGTTHAGAVARAVVRVIDVGAGSAIASDAANAAGYAPEASAAFTSAAKQATERAMADVMGRVSRHWPRAVSTRGRPLVKIRGAKNWDPIAAIIRALASTRGVTAVHPVRADRGSVDLGVESSLSAAKLASTINAVRTNAALAAQVQGTNVAVEVRSQREYRLEEPAQVWTP